MSPSKTCIQCGAEFGPEQRFCPNDGSALRPVGSNDPLIGQVIADRYQILQLLGEGGMGRVYAAEHVRMGRKSAVKVMSPNLALSAEAISRFNREASNASRINHPNVAQIYDFGETSDGMLYLAMEFVEGETLSTIIERGGPIAPGRAADIAKQIADALGAAHHLGIVHRDLKPDNVMIARHHDGADWVKVVDFGIAKTIQGGDRDGAGSQTVTTAGVSIGTPEYMSPEQLAGERLDSRTDQYSLGLVLFNMLTADLPYPRVTSKETLVRRLTSKPRTLHDVAPAPEWPAPLQAALDRALAPEPADRYPSVVEFGRDVVAAAASLGDSARTVLLAATARRPASLTPTQQVDRGAARVPPTIVSPQETRRPVMIVAGVLLVVGAAGAGALAAWHNRPHTAPAPTAAANTAAQSAAADSATVSHSDSAKPSVVAKTVPAATAPAVTPKQPAHSAGPAPTKAATQTAGQAARDTVAAVIPPAVEPAPAPVTSPDSVRAARDRETAQLRRGLLRANGDSAARSAPTNDADRIRVFADDIQGHFARANQFIQQGDVPKARAEFRDAMPVVKILRELYAGTPGELQVEQRLHQGELQTLQTCRRAMADSTIRARAPAAFHCEGLLPINLRPFAGRRGNPPAPPPGS